MPYIQLYIFGTIKQLLNILLYKKINLIDKLILIV